MPARTRTLAFFLVFLVGCQPPQVPVNDVAFLEGTWTTVKDGLSISLEVVREGDVPRWVESKLVDDGNQEVERAVLEYDKKTTQWTRVLTLADGVTSKFVGGVDETGRLVLEQVSYAGRPIEPPQSRLVYEARGPDSFVLDWQSLGANGAWVPRSSPFVHERVDRPVPVERIAFISNRSGNWDVYTINPDGTDLKALTIHVAGDHFPRWIAGGTRLAFRSQRARDDGGWDRWEIDLDRTDAAAANLPARLNNPDAGMFPEVHPSGSYLVNAAERDGEQDIYVWRFDGGGERALAPAPGLDYRPLFSPDGERVLFVSERDGNAEIYTVAFDGSDLRRLTDSPGIDRYARWSPDGRRIGFVSDRDGDLEVFVMDADGSAVRQLTHNEAEDGEISWSPQGTKLAYRSDASGNGEIHVVEVDTGTIEILTNHEDYDGEPTWSPGIGAR